MGVGGQAGGFQCDEEESSALVNHRAMLLCAWPHGLTRRGPRASWGWRCSSYPGNERKPGMPDEPVLREKAREAIRSGRLPIHPPHRTFGGPGRDLPCALCGVVLTREETEFEIEFGRAGGKPAFERYHLHQRCFAAWEFERTKMAL